MRFIPILLGLSLLTSCPFLATEEKEPAKEGWFFHLAVSYLGTSGNTSTHTLGGDFGFKYLSRQFGIEGKTTYMRAEQDNEKNAERFLAAVRGSRILNPRCELFLSGKWERDRYSGYDDRTQTAAGGTYRLIDQDKDELLFDLGISWNLDHPLVGSNRSYLGGLVQLGYTHLWSKTTKFQQRLLFIPNFAESSGWNAESETSIIASLSSRLSFKGSYLVRSNHLPPPGFKKTDTLSALTLVLAF